MTNEQPQTDGARVADQFNEALCAVERWGNFKRPTPSDRHEQIVAEIREEYPDADGEELLLRTAIRERVAVAVAVAMSPYEEDETYRRLSKVVKLFATEPERAQ